MGKQTPDTTGPMPTAERMTGASAVVIESPRPRVSVEIERMSKGPAKVSVRIDGEDSEVVGREALKIYASLAYAVEKLESPV